MSEHHSNRLDEPERRVVWLFTADDEAQVAALLATGWCIASRQTFGTRERVELREVRQELSAETPKRPYRRR